MSVYIQNIATRVPDVCLEQSFIREKMKDYVGDDPHSRRIIHQIYTHSNIKKRHIVFDDFHSNGSAKLFFKDDGTLGNPSTKTRNEIYTNHAKKLYSGVARKLITTSPEVNKTDISHVITVSCTGFYAPEPAFDIVRDLGLPGSAQRYHLGFMGCFAAFPALRMAHSICIADPEATVMIVSVELCSLHLQNSTETDQLVSGAIFGDGAAGVIVSNHEPEQKPAYRLEDFQTSIADNSEKDMTWNIGNTGFEMALSAAVPNIIEENLRSSVNSLLDDYDLGAEAIDHWAIHPGGRSILDKIENSMQLQPEQLASSRHVLSQFGNMSSATALFVLKEFLKKPPQKASERVLAMAFGPGLTIESGYLSKIS